MHVCPYCEWPLESESRLKTHIEIKHPEEVDNNNRGLYPKYNVTKADTGDVVDDCFVLRPDRDPHARAALQTYADSCEEQNVALCGDIRAWLRAIADQYK